MKSIPHMPNSLNTIFSRSRSYFITSKQIFGAWNSIIRFFEKKKALLKCKIHEKKLDLTTILDISIRCVHLVVKWWNSYDIFFVVSNASHTHWISNECGGKHAPYTNTHSHSHYNNIHVFRSNRQYQRIYHCFHAHRRTHTWNIVVILPL